MSERIARRALAGLALCLAIGAGSAQAQIPGWDGEDPKPAPPTPEQIAAEAQRRALAARQRSLQAELSRAWADTKEVSAHGPTTVKLGDVGTFKVPENYIYVPAPQGTRILRAYGTMPETNVIGIVVSTAPNQHWLAAVRHRRDGHVDDTGAKTWNAEVDLQRLRDVNADANDILVAKGGIPREIVGWIAPPQYDPRENTLRWSLSSRPKNEIENGNNTALYNTARLGRDGFYSVALTSNLGRIRIDRAAAETIINNITFNPGQTYADFEPGSDRVAGYGINSVAELPAERDTGLLATLASTWGHHGTAVLASLALAAGALGGLLRFRRTRRPVDA